MTYQWVEDVMLGLYDYMCRGERFDKVLFLVEYQGEGIVGNGVVGLLNET